MKGKLTLWIDGDLKRRIKIACAERDISVSKLLELLFEQWLKEKATEQLNMQYERTTDTTRSISRNIPGS